jgi:hypothetical protein
MPYIDIFQPNCCDNQSSLIWVVPMAYRSVASTHIMTADFNAVLKKLVSDLWHWDIGIKKASHV